MAWVLMLLFTMLFRSMKTSRRLARLGSFPIRSIRLCRFQGVEVRVFDYVVDVEFIRRTIFRCCKLIMIYFCVSLSVLFVESWLS